MKIFDLKHNEKLTVKTDGFPLGYYASWNTPTIKYDEIESSNFDIFKHGCSIDERQKFVVVGTFHYKNGEDEKFVLTCDHNFKENFENVEFKDAAFSKTNFNEKMNLIIDEEISDKYRTREFVGYFMSNEIKHGVIFEDIVKNYADQNDLVTTPIRIMQMDNNGDTLLDAAERINPEFADKLKHYGALRSSEVELYSTIFNQVKDNNALWDKNFTFDSEYSIHQRNYEENVVKYHYEDMFRYGMGFFAHGFKEFEDGRKEEFFETVDCRDALMLLVREDALEKYSNITFSEKVDMILNSDFVDKEMHLNYRDPTSTDYKRSNDEMFRDLIDYKLGYDWLENHKKPFVWDDLIKDGSMETIMKADISDKLRTNILNRTDAMGQTAVDNALEKKDLVFADELMKKGGVTAEISELQSKVAMAEYHLEEKIRKIENELEN